MRILLLDPDKCTAGGHHGVYRETIHKIPGTQIDSRCVNLPSIKKHPIAAYQVRKQYLEQTPSTDIAVLLYLDAFYITPLLLRTFCKRYQAVIGVLHWFPYGRIKRCLFKLSAKYITKIVVHSEYIKQQLNNIGIYNVEVIEYPIFTHINLTELETLTPNAKKVFTCLGGGRYDKGYDILADSFQYIPQSICAKIKFVIAGKQEPYIKELLLCRAGQKGIEIDIDDRILPEENYWQYIAKTDVILLPYRRIFTGNSGPMVDGVALNKFILGPDEGNLGFLIKKYHLGETFKIENSYALASMICQVSQKNTKCKHIYKKQLEVRSFIASYKKLFYVFSR